MRFVVRRQISIVIALAFFSIVVGRDVLANTSFALSCYIFGISAFTFLMYWVDKRKAGKNSWRTRESVLHFFGLMGGWPGAILAQQALRHKTSKTEFMFTFWATVVLNVILTLGFVTPLGRSAIHAIFR